METNYFHLLFLIVTLLITSCDSSDTPQDIGTLQDNDAPYTELDNFDVVPPSPSSASLKPVVSESELELYLKNGLKLINNTELIFNITNYHRELVESRDYTNISFSTTNTQEGGVDEADKKIEFDGEYLYVLTHSDYYWYSQIPFLDNVDEFGYEGIGFRSIQDYGIIPPRIPPDDVSQPGVRVMQRGDNASMNEIAWLPIDNQNGFDGLYLSGDVLAALSLTYGPVDTFDIDNDVWYWGKPQTRLDLMDVSTPAEINTTHTIVLDGHLVSSRRVDNKLVIITQYTPNLAGFTIFPMSEEERVNNKEILDKLDDTTLVELLPKKSINGESSAMLQASDCYVPENLPENTGYANLTVVSIINLQVPEEFTSSCFNSTSHGIYVNAQSLYIVSRSIIHKFSIKDTQPRYLASGSVPGSLALQKPAFRMSESGDHLRVISSRRNSAQQQWEHFLTILLDNKQGDLQQVGQLPNESQPLKIGHPFEIDLSVRFFQNRAYLGTFEHTDPVYVLDVSDAAAPGILGELKISGFNSNIYPVNENLLLAFGHEDWTNSKMSLFDVSNPEQPIEIEKFIWPNTSTPLHWDPHAFSFLELGQDHYRFAFPVESWIGSISIFDKYFLSNADLYMFDLNIENGFVDLKAPSVLPVSTNNYGGYAYGYNQRAIIHQDEVHYVYDYRVWSANWDLSVINPAQ